MEDSKPLACSWVSDDFRDLTARKTNFPEEVIARDAVDRRLVQPSLTRPHKETITSQTTRKCGGPARGRRGARDARRRSVARQMQIRGLGDITARRPVKYDNHCKSQCPNI